MFKIHLVIFGFICLFKLILSGKIDVVKEFIHDYPINPHNFSYTLNPEYDLCFTANDPVFLIVYVHTSPIHFTRRLSIRETWTRRSMFKDVRLVFMMGSTEDEKVSKKVQLESSLYRDIVQEDFMDSYRNLTYKGIMAMRWISKYCSDVKYILKVDDDIITNTFIIMRHLNSLRKYEIVSNKTILCFVWNGMPVLRDKKSKWYVSEKEYPLERFTRYCSGSAYMLTGDLAPLMYNASQYIKFFWVDDYYITGLLTASLNVTFKSLNPLYVIRADFVEKEFKGNYSDVRTFGHLSRLNQGINKMYNLWSRIYSYEVLRFGIINGILSSNKITRDDDFNDLDKFDWSSDIFEERNLRYSRDIVS